MAFLKTRGALFSPSPSFLKGISGAKFELRASLYEPGTKMALPPLCIPIYGPGRGPDRVNQGIPQ